MRSEALRRRRHRARRGEGDRLREEILESAERLLVSTGDAQRVSIRAIADAVGCTPPSIYLHFEDKDDLIYEVCVRYFLALNDRIEAAAAGLTDPGESLRRRALSYIRFGLERPEHYRIMFMTKHHSMPDGWSFDTSPGFEAARNLVGAVGRCTEAGVMRAGDPFRTAMVLWSGVHGITSLLVAMPDGFPWPDVDSLVDELLDVQMRGLAPGVLSRPTARRGTRASSPGRTCRR